MNSVLLYLARALLVGVIFAGALLGWAATSPYTQGFVLIGLSRYQKALLALSGGVLALTTVLYLMLWGVSWKSREVARPKAVATVSVAVALLASGCAYMVPFVGTGNQLHPWQTLAMFYGLLISSPLLLIKAAETWD